MKTVTRYECGVCGKRLRGGYIYSKHTGARYHPLGTKGCAPRKEKP